MPSEACHFNDHTMCRGMGCDCDCHRGGRPESQPQPASQASQLQESPELVGCPKCLVKRPGHERFCRKCGTQLGSLMCMGCNQVCEPSDSFCWACGCPLTKDAASRVPAAEPREPAPRPSRPPRPAPRQPAPLVEPEAAAANERAVLEALQRAHGADLHAAGRPAETERSWTLPSGSFKVSTKRVQAGGPARLQTTPFNPHAK